jgi:uncharacterized SAM-binding protein YcdF (DUF218 family)
LFLGVRSTVSILYYDSFLYAVEDFLLVNEEPKPADVIIVLGGGPSEVVAQGISFYKSGYADKLLFTGGFRAYENAPTEAQIMKRQALLSGVPEDVILLEEQSLTTEENAEYSLEIVRSEKFKSAIIVTSPYHTRRSSMLFHRFFKGIELTICSVPNNPRDGGKWWQNDHRAKLIVSEYLKLVYCFLFAR